MGDECILSHTAALARCQERAPILGTVLTVSSEHHPLGPLQTVKTVREIRGNLYHRVGVEVDECFVVGDAVWDLLAALSPNAFYRSVEWWLRPRADARRRVPRLTVV